MFVPVPPKPDKDGASDEYVRDGDADLAGCTRLLFLLAGAGAVFVLGVALAVRLGDVIVGSIGLIVCGAGLVIEWVGRGEAAARRVAEIALSVWRRLPTAVVGTGLMLVTAAAVVHMYPPGDESKAGRAKTDLMALTKAIESFDIVTGVHPATLQELAHPADGKPYVEADGLVDPWGRPYDYDPHGPRNRGKRPDIWTVTPDGELIGNWLLKK